MPLVQHVDPPLDAGQGLDALALESNQHPGRVLIRPAAHLGRLATGLIDDLGRSLLRELYELALLEHLGCLFLRACLDLVRLVPCPFGDPAGILGDALRLAHFVGHRHTQLIDQLQDRGLIENDVVGEGDLLGGRDE